LQPRRRPVGQPILAAAAFQAAFHPNPINAN
jgi:hypothetical protein